MFSMNDIIIKKRNGGALTKDEIKYFVDGYTRGDIPDYQASALLMAIWFRHMNDEETFTLTDCLRNSGETVDLSAIRGVKVDKHSTGGVGDKMTLAVAPTVAACGVPVAKMSGRGLGFTGGTVDKLASIPGFRTELEPEEFFEQVNKIGVAVIGQSAEVAPADKKLYALRDVTGTIDNLSLISSSIMSKKLASGCDAILLDVKCGSGAFMKTEEDALALAELMVRIGSAAGVRTAAAITDMNQPLGYAVGNALEVREVIETLKGRGPADIVELTMHEAGVMIMLGGKARSAEEGRRMACEAVTCGAALAKLREMIQAQGGDGRVVEEVSRRPADPLTAEVKADRSGFVTAIEAEKIGEASQRTGAGRAKKEDSIDPGAGIMLKAKVGDEVKAGDVLAEIYAADETKGSAALEEARAAFTIGDEPPVKQKLIRRTIGFSDN